MVLMKMLSIIVILIILYFIISWFLHVYTSKNHNWRSGWGNFQYFIREFNKYDDWETTKWHKWEFLSMSRHYKMDDSLIIFNCECMILPFFDYVKYRIWCHKKWNAIYKNDNVDWDR